MARAKVTVMPVALAQKTGRAVFSAGHGYASRLGAGTDTVETMRLDDLGLAPTLVKMHLEGGEFDAISGALEALQRARPKIAVTIYHNRDGLWRTLRLLMQALSNYDFHYRLHAWGATGAVVYGVPPEAVE